MRDSGIRHSLAGMANHEMVKVNYLLLQVEHVQEQIFIGAIDGHGEIF